MNNIFPVKLKLLENYYICQMSPNYLYVQTFDFTFNNVNCTILLDMSRKEISDSALDLYFLKKGTQESLSVPMSEDFYVKAHDWDKYIEIKKFFNIRSENNSKRKFNLFDFFKYVDKHMEPVSEKNMNRRERAQFYRVEEPDAIFYKTMILWDVVHKKNNTQKGNVTARNRAKVQKLLPDLYERIKNKNITVRFTSENLDEKKEEELINKEINNI